MKKVLLSVLTLFMVGTIAVAQTTVISTTPTYKTVKLSNDMVIVVPNGEMVYEYQVDANDLVFNSPEDRERYFNSMKDEVVTYRYDKTTNSVYMVLDRDYIERNKWTTTELNTYFSNRTTYMKDQYGNYIKVTK